RHIFIEVSLNKVLHPGVSSEQREDGNVARYSIYPKGAYILHMIRMMMYDQRDGDTKFQALKCRVIVSSTRLPATILFRERSPIVGQGLDQTRLSHPRW